MEFDKKNISDHKQENSDNIDLREIAEKYLGYWKWFLLAGFLSILFAFLYLNFERNIYKAEAVIKIKNENGGDASALSAFKDLGVLTASNQNVEDEMEILLSKDLIAEVLKSLKFNIQFFSDKNSISNFLDDNLSLTTEFYEKERYVTPPLEINFFISDSALYETNSKFVISIDSSNEFTFKDKENSILKNYTFGEKVVASFGELIITPGVDLKKNDLIGEDIMVKISSIEGLTNIYSERLAVEPKSEYSSVLSLTVTNSVRKKAEDFLTELVIKYNNRAIRLKESITKSTSEFVDRRLKIISDELSDVDLDAEAVKTRYRISDVASETGLNMQSGQTIENQIVQANTQLEKIGAIKDFVATKNDNQLIPVDVGVSDNNVSSSVQQYNELMMRKKRMLDNSTEKNPIVINLNKELKTLKVNIDQGLNNIESSQRLSLDALTSQGARISSRLYAAPKQERLYTDIKRQQQIKEQLFLYLLKKREETGITLGVADPNAKVIDSPSSLPNRIAPKKSLVYFGFTLLGLLLPFAFFYISDMFDRTIHNREEVEKALNIPIIGDIPKLESKTNYLIKKDDHSSVAEAIRIIRTNINYLLTNFKGTNGKVIFITSTIAHEGKSLVATNLATALAHAGKQTLLIGMDIRAPKIKDYLGVRGKIGVTRFIVDQDISVENIIVDVPNIENLNIISSGDLAPNPAELLMHPRVKELFSFAKDNYDYIIVDTAAYSMVTDTLLISHHADAFIYVLRTNFLDKRALKYIKSIYKENRLPNMALLVNGIDHKKSYGYGYGYGYGDKFEKVKSKKRLWNLKS